jgi:hypothetical protein
LAASNTDRHHYQGTTDEDLELPVVIWWVHKLVSVL